jgi:hypothetical protein
VVQLLLLQVGYRRSDIGWRAYQFGYQVADPSAVFYVAVEIEARRPARGPTVPRHGRGAMRVDKDTVAIEQQPVDLEGGHRRSFGDWRASADIMTPVT